MLARLLCRFRGIGADEPHSDTKVENLPSLPARQHSVLGLDIPMHNVLIMCRAQAFRSLHPDRQKFRHADRWPHPFPQGLPLDILHDEKDLPLLLDYVVDGSDVGVIEGGSALRFLQKSFAVTFLKLPSTSYRFSRVLLTSCWSLSTRIVTNIPFAAFQHSPEIGMRWRTGCNNAGFAPLQWSPPACTGPLWIRSLWIRS
jgi:hypothetical protein